MRIVSPGCCSRTNVCINMDVEYGRWCAELYLAGFRQNSNVMEWNKHAEITRVPIACQIASPVQTYCCYRQAIIKCVATDLHHLHIDYGRSLAITYLFTPKFSWKVKLIESSAELEYGKKQKKHSQLHRITNRFQRFTMQSVRWGQNIGVFLDVRS